MVSSASVVNPMLRDEQSRSSATVIMERNQKYEQHCVDIVGSDKFSKRGA